MTFTDAKERAKAFGIYGAIAGGGGAVGLILGGVLTEYLDWRWTFFVNIPFAVVAALGGALRASASQAATAEPLALDIPGVLSWPPSAWSRWSTASPAPSPTAGATPTTVGCSSRRAVLLVAFVVVESRVEPRCCRCASSSTATAAASTSLGLAIIGMFGLFLFLTYYLQRRRATRRSGPASPSCR